MKKKIIFGVTVCLFIMATVFCFNISQQSNIRDLALKNIEVMSYAKAEESSSTPCIENGSGCTANSLYYPTKKEK